MLLDYRNLVFSKNTIHEIISFQCISFLFIGVKTHFTNGDKIVVKR